MSVNRTRVTDERLTDSVNLGGVTKGYSDGVTNTFLRGVTNR